MRIIPMHTLDRSVQNTQFTQIILWDEKCEKVLKIDYLQFFFLESKTFVCKM